MSTLEDPDLAKGKNGGARASMQNVAAYAGVSIATVSKVMQGVPTVLPENVTKVQNAIEALGYRINPLGAELRRGRRSLVGLIVPTLQDQWTARLIAELELAVESHGFVLFVASSHESGKREADLANRMLDWRVTGVIVVPIGDQPSGAGLLFDDADTPAVFIQKEVAGTRFDTVIRAPSSRPKDVAAKAASSLFARLENPEAPPIVISTQEPRNLSPRRRASHSD